MIILGLFLKRVARQGDNDAKMGPPLITSKSELIVSIDDEFEGIIPKHDSPNHAALGFSLGKSLGVIDPNTFDDATQSAATTFESVIDQPDHVVFLLLDGFGMNFVETLPKDSFMRQHIAMTMCSTLPTSTGPNLMSLATGRWPGTHGNLGWDVHIPRLGERIQPLPWRLTRTGQPLHEVGFNPAEMMLTRPIPFRQLGTFTFIVKEELAETTTTQMYGQTETLGFTVEGNPASEIVELASSVINCLKGRTFTYIYWNEVDSAAHSYGEFHPMTRAAVLRAAALTEALGSALKGKARFLATADHGHLDSPTEVWTTLRADSPLSRHLRCVPAGEPRTLFFHTRPGAGEAFEQEFNETFGERFALMACETAVALGLFGPSEFVTEEARARMGDFFALSRGRWSIYAADDAEDVTVESMHGGITTAESVVPLIVI